MPELKSHLFRHQTSSNPAPRKSDRTRASILSGALKFLWIHPFREMTVAELMSITGVSRSAFYQYFKDLHELMETLLQGVEQAIFEAAEPWFLGEGDAPALLHQSLCGLVDVCFEYGPILRAVAEASTTDERLEQTWAGFLGKFDDAVSDRIEKYQESGSIPQFDPRPIAIALNRMDVSMLIHAFGRHPRNNHEPVRDALIRIWMSTLYNNVQVDSGTKKSAATSGD